VASGAAATLALLVICAIAPAVANAAIVFDATPAGDTNQTTATFKFHDSAGATNFSCKLDSQAPIDPCTSPHTFTNVSEGRHTVAVQVTVGATQPPPGTFSWTVDLTPPTTQVTGQPPALTTSTTATFTFTSPDATASFRCALNGAAPQACTSPLVLSGLADATRSMLIQAVDPAGNVDIQAQPIVWTVDTTPPDTILANPGNLTGNQVPVFNFTSTEPGSTFQCSFNNAAYTACTSPLAVDVLHSGSQSFKVRAIDPAGNVDPTPATDQWTSDLTPPKRPKVTIFPAPSTAKASSAAPVLKVTPNPGLGVVFTNPLANLLSTPTFTLATRLQAQWKSDSSAVSYDVTVTTFPDDSTGMDERGDDVLTIKQYSRTKRTALKLTLFPGATVCLKVDARDKVGNVSGTRTSCTTIPNSFAPLWGPFGFQRVRDPKAWRGHYIVIAKGKYLTQSINDSAFFSPSKAVLVAERCPGCGSVELAFTKFPLGAHPLRDLVTANLSGKTDHQDVIEVKLPRGRLERDGEGLLVLLRVTGKPRLSGVGFTT
jgi:hypothetical protein